jgi:hypothetical protein
MANRNTRISFIFTTDGIWEIQFNRHIDLFGRPMREVQAYFDDIDLVARRHLVNEYTNQGYSLDSRSIARYIQELDAKFVELRGRVHFSEYPDHDYTVKSSITTII